MVLRQPTCSRTRLAPTLIQVAKSCLSVWLYSVRKLQREKSVGYLQSGLSHERESGILFYNTWYLKVTSDVAPSQISKAFLRDFKDEDVTGEGLARRIILLVSFRKKLAYVSLTEPEELSTYWYALAAYRRHLCSGHWDDDTAPPTHLSDLEPKQRAFEYVG